MAQTVRTTVAAGNIVSGTDPSATFAPASGDLVVVYCSAVGSTNLTPTCSDGNTGGTYTRVAAVQNIGGSGINGGQVLSCFVRDNSVPNTTSTTVTVVCGAHTAVEITIVAISGSTVYGTSAIRQSATNAGAASTIPVSTFSSTAGPSDLILSGCGNGTNPAGVQFSALGATNYQNVGQTNGANQCGLAVSAIPNGFNTTVLGWGTNSSATQWQVISLEIFNAANTGVNTSKLMGYGLLGANTGVNTSKLMGYGLLGANTGVNVSKLVGYAILAAVNTNPPVWNFSTMPTGYTSNPYSITWDLAPAAAPTTYSVVSGSLPPGLSLSSPSADIGTISGTPTTVGTYPFTLRATNAYGTADQAFSITISTPVIVGGSGGSFVFIN